MCLFFLSMSLNFLCIHCNSFSLLQIMFMLKCMLVSKIFLYIFCFWSFVKTHFLAMPNDNNDGSKSLMCQFHLGHLTIPNLPKYGMLCF
jgi:hypothetical protein